MAVTQKQLDGLSSLEKEICDKTLKEIGGMATLIGNMEVDPKKGLTDAQVSKSREVFGPNEFPESPMDSYLELLIGALNDPTLLVLLAAATVALGIGIYEEGPETGWIEGGAIYIAVILVSNIAAGNDYSKQLQFAALEKTSADDEKCMVMRSGVKTVLNPREIVVGDVIVLQAGDQIPADCLLIEDGIVMSSQASLTGEPEDLKKDKNKDFTIYSSCLVSECGDNFLALAVGVGENSQWGKIKATLAVEAKDTPLQEKLNIMTEQIGYIGMGAAALTFISLVISIWTRHHGEDVLGGFVEAFILAVTIIVVAIPEGLPLAVTIALAYSTKEMYKDQCLIRVLAACETMGNATNICSDKTGTLTENRMTVVTGWFSGKFYKEEEFDSLKDKLPKGVKECIVDQTSINRVANLVFKDGTGQPLPPDRPMVVGNKTEGALMIMAKNWGFEYESVREAKFNETNDKIFAFNSSKKRSTAVVHQKDGSVRVFVKGASEWVLKDCTKWSDESGKVQSMDAAKRAELNTTIDNMANGALRTLVLAHVDFNDSSNLPKGWSENPPDSANLICDCIVGIIDPLRSDVIEAVATAQGAGVVVRMVTGDNIATASAIAKQAGILTEGGMAVEGPVFRQMTPAEADKAIVNLQVMARSSPDDKHLLVTRLNGGAIPQNQEEWEAHFAKYPEYKWETHKDLLLPGYKEEWESSRPHGGQVVGVTGDGTNDAPALKAADVGLSMGITGTKVAQSASDIVILDDKFSSIVQAIMWGRSVFDNIRKFLQFQLTVNVVALILVFIGAAAGFGQPLTAVQMLWVNLVMDTLGALALGTEKPTRELLERKPYKRNTSLVSWPMWRNIFAQSAYQLILLFVLLFAGAEMFGVNNMADKPCTRFSVTTNTGSFTYGGNTITCPDWKSSCNNKGTDCYNKDQGGGVSFSDFKNFKEDCLKCEVEDFEHGTIIFNAFIWCQIFNEYTSRNLGDKWNCLEGITGNFMFLYVSIFSALCQFLIVQYGADFTSTSPLTGMQWLITILLGLGSMLAGVAMRFIPVPEDPNSFFGNDEGEEEDGTKSYSKVASNEVALEMTKA